MCCRRWTLWCNIITDLCTVHKARARGHQERRLGQRCLQREAVQRGGDGGHAGRRSEEGLGQCHHPHHYGRHPSEALSCGVGAARPVRFNTHRLHCWVLPCGSTLFLCSSGAPKLWRTSVSTAGTATTTDTYFIVSLRCEHFFFFFLIFMALLLLM